MKTVMEFPGTVLTFLTTNKHSNTTTEMMLHSYVTIKLAGPKLPPSAVETILLFMGKGNRIMLGDLNADKKCAKFKTPGLPDRIYSKCHNLKFAVLGKSKFSGDKVKVCTSSALVGSEESASPAEPNVKVELPQKHLLYMCTQVLTGLLNGDMACVYQLMGHDGDFAHRTYKCPTSSLYQTRIYKIGEHLH